MTIADNTVTLFVLFDNIFVLCQVQPVDSTSINELQTKKTECKHILTSSPIVKITWDKAELIRPITVSQVKKNQSNVSMRQLIFTPNRSFKYC